MLGQTVPGETSMQREEGVSWQRGVVLLSRVTEEEDTVSLSYLKRQE